MGLSLVAAVPAPSDKVFHATVTPLLNKKRVIAEFEPTEVGLHVVSVLADGKSIVGSPFATQVYDITKAKAGPFPSGLVGKSYEFNGKSKLYVFGTVLLIDSRCGKRRCWRRERYNQDARDELA